ncbi:MAG: GntR family transcriptional regulator, partial [Actinomycetes bacterium]
MAKKKIAPPKTKRSPRRSVLSDEIYDMIKAMIFEHEIAPGSRVNIDALAVELQVSQTPVREALARLESDGLIAKEPLKGYTATNLLSMEEFNDLFQFRLLIEPWAAEQAAIKIDSTGKTALKGEMQSAKAALKFRVDDQFQALTEHDARFHTLIAHISGSSSVASAFERTHCHLHLFRLFMAKKLQLIENESR